ncbi:MAG: hypothetical protein D6731_15325 [Planctomycetota bacterium]|nr:MAG: hypothetical protein D6731_15325 [Planctomycetota bacterium]
MPLPASDNYFLDNPDLRWNLEHAVPWEELYALTEPDPAAEDAPGSLEEAREFYLQVLEEVGRIVANEVAPRVEAIDATGCRLEDGEVVMAPPSVEIFELLRETGLYGLTVPRELGGMNCPLVLYFTLGEIMARADCGTMTHFSFYGGIAMTLLVYAAREGKVAREDGRLVCRRFAAEIEEIARGDAWGAMVLTEPGAGSDLGAIKTRAVRAEDGTWRLSGEKIFITSGHAQYQIVLARTSDPAEGASGLEGLSVFLVPRFIERDGQRVENVKVTKVEKKLGHNSSPTVSLLYEDSVGELIGSEGEGFRLMLLLMNNARVAVGFEGLGVCEAALRMARAYAEQRVTMGKPIKDHELIADMLQEMDTQIRGMRALTFAALVASELAQKLEMKLAIDPPADPAEVEALRRRQRRHQRRARELTPLVKYVTSEKAVQFARWNMQIHGGMGYISETGADRLLRDALVLPVYEGTSQIQALMALKDHLGSALKNPTGFVAESARLRIEASVSRGLERALDQLELRLRRATESIVARIVGTKVRSEWSRELASRPGLLEKLDYLRTGFLRSWDARSDFGHGLLHAERLTRILADVETARILVRQAAAHPEREPLARRYLARALPRVTAWAMEIESSDLEDLVGASVAEGDLSPAR